MNLFEILGQTLKELTKEGQCSKAEVAALYSDIVDWKFPQQVFESAYLALNASILLPFLGFNSITEEKLRNQLNKIAYQKNYQGYWKLVSTLVETEPYVPARVLEKAIEKIGTNAFFGNHLKSMRRIKNNMIAFNPYEPSNAPVRKPQRKRGYNDKGHLPLKHLTPIGHPLKKERPKPQEITEEPRFYSTSLIGDRSNIAAELVRKPTSARKRRRSKRKTERCKDNSKRYYSKQKVTKEEWLAIFNSNK